VACRYVKPDPGLYRPAEGNLLRRDAGKSRRPLGWTHRIGSEELVREMVGRTAARKESNTREGNCSPGAGTPWGQRNPFDKRFCPALWLERAFLDRDFTGVIHQDAAHGSLRVSDHTPGTGRGALPRICRG
jgi:hypothetical protein